MIKVKYTTSISERGKRGAREIRSQLQPNHITIVDSQRIIFRTYVVTVVFLNKKEIIEKDDRFLEDLSIAEPRKIRENRNAKESECKGIARRHYRSNPVLNYSQTHSV